MKTNRELEQEFKKYQGSLEQELEIRPNGYWDPNEGRFHNWTGYSGTADSYGMYNGQNPVVAALETVGSVFGITPRSEKDKEAAYTRNNAIKQRNAQKTEKFSQYVNKEITERNEAKRRFAPTDNYRLYER